jgi:hypothetical protein
MALITSVVVEEGFVSMRPSASDSYSTAMAKESYMKYLKLLEQISQF